MWLIFVCEGKDIAFLQVSYFKDFTYLFVERGKEGERQGEKHQCVVASTGDLAHNAGAPTRNRTSNLPALKLVPNPLSHTSQGPDSYFKSCYILLDLLNEIYKI